HRQDVRVLRMPLPARHAMHILGDELNVLPAMVPPRQHVRWLQESMRAIRQPLPRLVRLLECRREHPRTGAPPSESEREAKALDLSRIDPHQVSSPDPMLRSRPETSI